MPTMGLPERKLKNVIISAAAHATLTRVAKCY
jgi:hypothetical protein